jgi:hypothetical protein
MAKQNINVGATANDKKGDSLRAAFQKVNANFTELYTQLGLFNDPTLNLGAFEFTGSILSTTDSSPIVIDQATTITSNLTVGGDILPSSNLGSNLGSPTKRFKEIFLSGNTIYLGDTPISAINGTVSLPGITTGGTIGVLGATENNFQLNSQYPNYVYYNFQGWQPEGAYPGYLDVQDSFTWNNTILNGQLPEGFRPAVMRATVGQDLYVNEIIVLDPGTGYDLPEVVEWYAEISQHYMMAKYPIDFIAAGEDMNIGAVFNPIAWHINIGLTPIKLAPDLLPPTTVPVDISELTDDDGLLGGGSADTGDWTFTGNVAYNGTNFNQGLYVAPGGESTSYVFVPGNSESDSTALQLNNGSSTGQVTVTAYNKQWEFDSNGDLTLPSGGDILDSTGASVLGGSDFTTNVDGSKTLTIESETTTTQTVYAYNYPNSGASFVLKAPGNQFRITGSNSGVNVSVFAEGKTVIFTSYTLLLTSGMVWDGTNWNADCTVISGGAVPDDIILYGYMMGSVQIITTTPSEYEYTFGGDGSLTFPDATIQTTAYIPGNIRSEGNINIDINLTDSTLRRWQFGEDGDLTVAGAIQANDNLNLRASGGIPISISNINSQGGYDIGSYTGLTTTGGTGTGLTVNASTAGNGYISTVTIATPGTGYTDGDSITLVGGDGFGCTFTIGTIPTWTFGIDGRTTFPNGTVPAHSYGAVGDRKGMVAFDATYIYYCTADYVNTSTDIWKRTAHSAGTW